MMSMTLAHFLRSEGHARLAGAAVATAFSNLIAMLFLLTRFGSMKEKTVLSLSLRDFRMKFAGQVFSVGIASAFTSGLATLSNITIVKLASGYGDISVAAYGIVKKIDMFPLGISMGLCQGFMPLVGYNYAAKNYRRMREVSVFSWKTG